MRAKVWFKPIREGESLENIAGSTVELAEKAGLSEIIEKDGLTGILQHVGEGRGTGYIKPEITGALARRILTLGGKPFLTGSSTLYRGRRNNAYDHIMQAYEHGFIPQTIGCPIIMCDGLRGADQITVELPNARHCKQVFLGSAVQLMRSLVVVTHPTGHCEVGYGGAIKNVAMGLASRGGKLAMHHGSYPLLRTNKCVACGICARWCPAEAIVIRKHATILQSKCIGCGQCFSVCPHDAFDFSWATGTLPLQERLVEYCAGVKTLLGNKILYINVMTHFQKECDCFDKAQKPVCRDIGILASRDMVAIDTATIDLINSVAGKNIIQQLTGCEYARMFEYSEEWKLGSTRYELIET
jgi:uncharacterized Fe-S center protein